VDIVLIILTANTHILQFLKTVTIEIALAVIAAAIIIQQQPVQCQFIQMSNSSIYHFIVLLMF